MLRRARLFVTCLPVRDARKAAHKLRYSKPLSIGDPQVVLVSEIWPHIEDAISKHDAEHLFFDAVTGQAVPQKSGISGVAWLVHESGVPERRLYGYRRGEREYMSLRHADDLLTAIGRTDLLGDEIEIKKNPNWSWHKYRRWQRGLITEQKYG